MLTIFLSRLSAACNTIPTAQDWLLSAGILLIYGMIALPLGFWQGFLQLQVASSERLALGTKVRIALTALAAPATIEELVFRVLLLPQPMAELPAKIWWLWGIFSLLLFIIYHPLNALSFFPAGFPTFLEPIFLILAGFLGLGCTFIYWQTGSVWLAVVIHWVVVVLWLLWLGGYQKLGSIPMEANVDQS
ncbi:MAG: CPBP family intramembrane metalloprotease [Symploca sp. SIO2G7]|nr:CPBP family intramembrane metalloprotease [Symploca sp. SIO2G7]